MATTKRRMRDFQRCLRNIGSFSDNQAQLTEWDEDQLEWVEVMIRPNDGYYVGGQFVFKIYFEKNYPKHAPRVDCSTPIYHPNIDTTCDEYNVCLSLFDEWEDTFGLEDIIQGLLFLLYNPNIEDPLSPYFEPDMEESEFKDNIESSLKGGDLDGVTEEFPENNTSVRFNEDELTKGIELILEKASQMVLKEEEENDEKVLDSDGDDDSEDERESSEDVNNDNNIEDNATSDSVISRQDSKVEKNEVAGPVEPGCGASSRGDQPSWSKYIPQMFIPPQPEDFIVGAFMAGINMAVS